MSCDAAAAAHNLLNIFIKACPNAGRQAARRTSRVSNRHSFDRPQSQSRGFASGSVLRATVTPVQSEVATHVGRTDGSSDGSGGVAPPVNANSESSTSGTLPSSPPSRDSSIPRRPSKKIAISPPTTSAYSALGHRIKGAENLPLELIERCCTHISHWHSEDLSRTSRNRTLKEKGQEKQHNQDLATIGNEFLGLIVTEHVEARWPNLPNSIMKLASAAYAGTATCAEISRYWGVYSETAVTSNPNHPKYSTLPKGKSLRGVGEGRRAGTPLLRWSRSNLMASDSKTSTTYEVALASVARAVVGAILQEHGFAYARQFIRDHFLSRQINIASLLKFHQPQQILKSTLLKYDKDAPISRLLSETGRHSVSPLFIVGVFTTNDERLGEALGSSLKMAEYRACEDALRRIYLSSTPFSRATNSPGTLPLLPSDTLASDQSAYNPAMGLQIGDDEAQHQSSKVKGIFSSSIFARNVESKR